MYLVSYVGEELSHYGGFIDYYVVFVYYVELDVVIVVLVNVPLLVVCELISIRYEHITTKRP